MTPALLHADRSESEGASEYICTSQWPRLAPNMEALEIDHDRKEPFLRLPDRHSNIILTPPRSTDSDAIVTLLNDPRVYMTLEGPPYPYEHRFAVEWLERVKSKTDLAWTAIRHSSGNEMFGASPVRILREVNDDGSQTFLGDCGIERWGYPDVENLEERERLVTGNLNRPDGDVGIIWTIGGGCTQHASDGFQLVTRLAQITWRLATMARVL